MYCSLNYKCSHQNRISYDFIYYHENSKNSDFIHKLIHSLIMYLFVKSSSTILISFDTDPFSVMSHKKLENNIRQ